MKLPLPGEWWEWRGCLRHECGNRYVLVSQDGYIGKMPDEMKREVVQCCLVKIKDPQLETA
jgi:hypothetical protein